MISLAFLLLFTAEDRDSPSSSEEELFSADRRLPVDGPGIAVANERMSEILRLVESDIWGKAEDDLEDELQGTASC